MSDQHVVDFFKPDIAMLFGFMAFMGWFIADMNSYAASAVFLGRLPIDRSSSVLVMIPPYIRLIGVVLYINN